MNKKGFTLVELLAVIVILAVILTIAVPNMFKIIDKSKQDSYDNQVKMITDAAKKYVVSNNVTIDAENGSYITVAHLVSAGFFEETPKNPKTKEDMAGCVKISDSEGSYTYEYEEKLTTCSGSGSTPIVPETEE